MAAYDGNLLAGNDTGIVYGNPDLGQFPSEFEYDVGFDPLPTVIGEGASNQPVSEPGTSHSGNLLGEFGLLDFYYRIHIEYHNIALGAVVNDVETPFYIFNAYLTPVMLESAEFVGDTGTSLVLPHAEPPVEYAPLAVKTYVLNTSESGPATIDGIATFVFDVQTVALSIDGLRVLVWRWSPNWVENVRERLTWATDVIRTYDGSEQRRRLRQYPRQDIEFTFDLSDGQLNILENTIFKWGSRLWVVPFWPDVLSLVEDLPSGSDSVPIDPTTRLYTPGELLIFVDGTDESSYEALQVESVEDDHVVTLQPTSREWPAGTFVYPARLMRLNDGPALVRFVKSHSYGVASFKSYHGVQYDSLTEATYLGYPVVTREPNRDHSLQYQRQLEIVDFDVGLSQSEDESQIPDIISAQPQTIISREEIGEFREFLYARAGRHKAVWVPSFYEDLVLSSEVTAVTNTIQFRHAGIVDLTEGNIHRRDIRIELNDGTVLYRRVSNPVEVSDEIEQMDLSSPLGVDVEVTDVKVISWMVLSRLDADSLELVWESPHVVECLTVYRSFR